MKRLNNPKVTVITPVYNGERYVALAIESALGQTYGNIEVFIVNDGSTDRSYEKIRPYLALANVKYLEQKNSGVAAARNAAIRRSSGELVSFLDQDDLWMPEKLEAQVDYLRSHPEAGLVHSRQLYIDSSGNPVQTSEDWQTDVEGMCFKELFIKNRISVLCALVRRRCFEELGLFNESLSMVDDYEMWLRVSRSFPIGFVDRRLAMYRIHDSNASYAFIKLVETELMAINSIIGSLRDGELEGGVIRERLYELHFRLGSLYMWQKKDAASARGHFLRAIRTRPEALDAYRQFLWCSLSPARRKAIEWHWQRLKKALAKKAVVTQV